MATQYTSILKLALPVTGELSGTWGDVVNNNITSMVEQAIAGLSTINTWTANAHTLTVADGTTSESRCAMLVAANGSGGTALSAAGEIICPAASKLYVLKNGSSYAVTLKTAAGTGVAVPAGDTAFLFCDGTNVNSCVTTVVNGHISGNLTVDGNTTLGDANTDTVTVNAQFNTDLLPSTDNARDLGSTAKSWRTLYCDTSVLVGNLSLSGNTLSSTDTNGNIVIAPNGNGDVQLDADTVRVGDSAAAVTLTSNGAGALTVTTGGAANLILNTNSGTNSGAITIANGAGSNITIAPDGTGDVQLDADTVRIGDANTDVTLTTNGTGNLNLSTNGGTNSGTIQIAQGTNGNITFTPNGTGIVTAAGATAVTPTARTSGAASYFTVTTPADTGQTASTEVIGSNFTAATRSWATGALTLQRERVFGAPTYAFAGASTLTTAVNVDIGLPVAGTNATITNAYALRASNTLFTGDVVLNNASAALDLTNLEVTNIKAKDGTAAMSIADSTGAVTVSTAFAANGGVTIGDASGDAFTINSSAVSTPNGLNFDSNTLVIDAANNRVGIGTNMPGYNLTVSGKISYNGAIGEGADNTVSSSGTTLILGESATWTALSLRTDGSEQARLTSSGLEIKQSQLIGYSSYAGIGSNGLAVAGNVGIGTSSPLTNLHVTGSGNGWVTIQRGNDASQIAWLAWMNKTSNANQWGMGLGTAGSNNFNIFNYATSSNALVIDTSGNLGLGVTPSAWDTATPALQIKGRLSLSGYLGNSYVSNNAYNAPYGWVYITSNPASQIRFSDNQILFNTAPSGTANTTTITNGVSYTIITSGNQTDFGAANNNVGTAFTANSSGTLSSGTVSQNISFNQAMTLAASGNLLIGTTTESGSGRLRVVDSIRVADSNAETNALLTTVSATAATIETRYSTPIILGTGATERARITSGGYFKASNAGTYQSSTGSYHELRQSTDETTVYIANTASSLTGTVRGIRMHYTAASPNGTDNYFFYCDDSTALRAGFRSNGGLANYQSNNSDLSDIRTKTDINPLGSYWNKIAGLEIVTYKYKDQTHDDLNIGVIAQQVEQVAPEFVDPDGFGETPEDGVPLKTIYNKDLTFAAIKALQEAMARIEQLEAKVAALEAN
jgi:hypothetical protein